MVTAPLMAVDLNIPNNTRNKNENKLCRKNKFKMNTNLVMKQLRLLYRSCGNITFRDNSTFNKECLRNFRYLYLNSQLDEHLLLSTLFQNLGFMLGYDKYQTSAELLKMYGFKPCVYLPIYLQPYARCYLYKTVSFYDINISKPEKILIWNLLGQYKNEVQLDQTLANLKKSPYGTLALRVAEVDYMSTNSNETFTKPLCKYEYKLITKAIQHNLE